MKTEDIGEKERMRKTLAVLLFVMDAGGLRGRLAENGERQDPIVSSRMDSYQKRDKIGMVAFGWGLGRGMSVNGNSWSSSFPA